MIEVENVAFAYAGGATPVLDGLSLRISKGDFVSLLGRNGCGKSTLAKLLNGLLLPTQGRVMVDGLQTGDRTHLWEIRQRVQLVFQNPDNQLVGWTVEEDIAFGLQNLGVLWPEMGERIDWALDFAWLRPLRFRPVSELSGGEKQRVALAGVLAMKPQCVILDEATSMLDDEGKEELLGLVHAMNKDLGMAVVQITQSLEDILDGDRILVLDGGRIALEGSPSSIFAAPERLEAFGLIPPPLGRLGQALAAIGVLPSEVSQALSGAPPRMTEPGNPHRAQRAPALPLRRARGVVTSPRPGDMLFPFAKGDGSGGGTLAPRPSTGRRRGQGEGTPGRGSHALSDNGVCFQGSAPPTQPGGPMQIELRNVSYSYNRGHPGEVRALQGVSVVARGGEVLAVLGREGSGKTTLLQHLNGLLLPSGGQVLVDGDPLTPKRAASLRTRVALVFQYPEHQLFAPTVFDDIAFAVRRQSFPRKDSDVERRVGEAADLVGLDLGRLRNRRPLEPSGGERRRVAIAGALVGRPDLLLLDEPLSGLDPVSRRDLTVVLQRLRVESGMGIVIVSHSLEESLSVAERFVVLHQWMVVFEGGSEELLRRREDLARWGLRLPVTVQIVDLLRSRGMELPAEVWRIPEVLAAIRTSREGNTPPRRGATP